jgi:hypothetical protein
MKKHLYFSMFSIFSLLACGSWDTVDVSDVNEDKIHRIYKVDFDATSNRTSYFAQFRLGGSSGTTLRLGKPTDITIDKKSMLIHEGESSKFNLIGTFYHLTESHRIKDLYTYSWKRQDGSIVENHLSMIKPFSIHLNNKQATYELGSGDLTVVWDFEIGDHERMEVTLHAQSSSTAEGQTAYLSTKATKGNKAIFSEAEMQTFVEGKASLVAKWRRKVAIKQQNNGRLISTFTTRPFWINIKTSNASQPER